MFVYTINVITKSKEVYDDQRSIPYTSNELENIATK